MIPLAAGLFGALIGSFLNVVVHRVPLGRSLSSPPSACPRCGHRIQAWDNIPVVSWVLLGGRCRGCRTAISLRYPLVELGTAAFFAVVAWQRYPSGAYDGASGDGWSSAATASGVVLIAFLYLAAVSVALALIDLDTHRLPDRIVLPAYVVGGVLLTTAAAVVGDYPALVRGAIGLAVLWFAYFAMAWLYPGGMGFGDVKLAGVLGLYLGWLGWEQVMFGAFAAFLLGGMFAIVLLATRRADRTSGIPFGPWMLAGAWAGIFFGEQVAEGYLALFGLT
ncbi:MAG: prepilin peptidase [Microbacteriaceae bacterium]|jgi:leader peptidase (prepilin peptidase)/N-methyltransferase|nr:prepilin peptidase [Microbacteriaceae bacterium]